MTIHTKIDPSSLLESVHTRLDLSQTKFTRHFWPSCYICRLRSADVLYLYSDDWDAQGNMHEVINLKGADMELDF